MPVIQQFANGVYACTYCDDPIPRREEAILLSSSGGPEFPFCGRCWKIVTLEKLRDCCARKPDRALPRSE